MDLYTESVLNMKFRNTLKLLIFLTPFLLLAPSVQSDEGQIFPRLTASRVYGQMNFQSNSWEQTTARSIEYPEAIALDTSGALFATDTSNYRVIVFPPGKTSATKVYGQIDLTSGSKNDKKEQMKYSIFGVMGLCLDNSGGTYITDTTLNRVLFFPPGKTIASRLYGQPDFNSGKPNYSQYISREDLQKLPFGRSANAKGLDYPSGCAVGPDNGLYLVDETNNRVLYFPPGKTVATRVYGQPDLHANTPNTGGISAKSLYRPTGAIAIDPEGGLYIGDGNDRILYYPPGETTATRVYGQPDFKSASYDISPFAPVSSKTLASPMGLAVGNNGGLYVADTYNNRVLYFPPGETTATRVYGQPDFTSNEANNGGVTDHTFSSPQGLALDKSGGLYVGDMLNNRILYFPPEN